MWLNFSENTPGVTGGGGVEDRRQESVLNDHLVGVKRPCYQSCLIESSHGGLHNERWQMQMIQ